MGTVNSDKPLTVAQAAEYLSVNPFKVREYINKGMLKAYKLGNGAIHKNSKRRWRILKADLDAFVTKNANVEG